MEGKLSQAIFWALVGVFIVIACVFFIPAARELIMGSLFLFLSGGVFCLLGGALIFLTVKEKVSGLQKKFLLLTGASAAGFIVSIALHNAIYGLFIHFFGANFWNGGDEPFFFIMAVIVCPLGFLVGAVGSIVLAIRNLRMAEKSASSP